MHYYKFNIGDYTSHTQHLDEMEDLAYRRMLDWCYLHESPLPDNPEQISRLIRMRSHSESIALVLQEFFVLDDFGWSQPKVQREIESYKDRSNKAKASAEARWAKRPVKSNANALQTECESNANHKPLTINHKPLTKDLNTSQESKITCPHREILKIWDEVMPNHLTRHNPDLWKNKPGYRNLQARWGEMQKVKNASNELCYSTKEQGLDWWRRFLAHMTTSEFCVNGWRGFSLESLIQKKNFYKAIENGYHQ